MLASTVAASTLLASMADDSMELSSEHDRNMDEDIDIDFNYDQDQIVDTDYMEEDATSVHGFGSTFQPRPSPARPYDDFMADDDDESYSMTDADALRDDNALHTEPESMPSGVAEASHSGEVDLVKTHDEATFLPQEVGDTPAKDAVEQEVTETNVHLTVTKEMNPEAEPCFNVLDIERPEEAQGRTPTRASREATPQASNSPSVPYPIETKSPQTALPDPVPPSSSNHEHDPNDDPKKTQTTAATANVVEEPEEKADEAEETVDASYLDDESAASTCNIIVTWRDTEYTLFSSSELDDPDTFFLSDYSIIHNPLSSFFEAIREVIHEELADEDELCLAVESLGLEAEEASCLLQDVTLAQIITVHQVLLHNDGIDESIPLYIAFSTRPDLSKRVKMLLEGAADGKTVSELIPWTEGSDSLEAFVEAEESKPDFEISGDNISHDPLLSAHGAADGEDEADQDEASSVPGALTEDAILVPDRYTDEDHAPVTETSEENSAPETTSKDANSSHLTQSSKQEYSASGEYDEDSDLIDYSEDEIEQPKEQKRHNKNTKEKGDSLDECRKTEGCLCPKCTARMHQELEEANKRLDEDVRRCSLSRAVDESLHGHPESAEGPFDDDLDNTHDLGDEYDEYDEYAGDDFEHGEGETSAVDFTGEGDEEPTATEQDEEHFGDEEFEHAASRIDESTYPHDSAQDAEQFEGEEPEHVLKQNDDLSYQHNTEQAGLLEGEEFEHSATQHDEATYPYNTEHESEEFGEEELIIEVNHNDGSTYHHDIDQYLGHDEGGGELEENNDFASHVSQGEDHDSKRGPTVTVEFADNEPIDFSAIDYQVDPLEAVEDAESSATMSGEEIHQRGEFDEEVFDSSNGDGDELSGSNEEQIPNGNSEQKDEIDYEDDEDDIATINPPESKDVSSVWLGPSINGKRPREDVESEDYSTIGNKDAKRRRS